MGAPKVQVLARNDAPHPLCALCGVPATRICGLCNQEMERDVYGKGGADQHPCGDTGTDGFLLVANAPRVGLCACTGSE